eukprot:763077-Hanusia_phi.AAC.2
MNLVIVESSTKAKKIQGFLGKDFKVIASFGHIVDLPQKELGVDTNSWVCNYVPTKPDIIKRIKDAASEASDVYLASDPDREGHAIAYHISKLIPKNKRCCRIIFNEITKDAIKAAIDNKTDIDVNMFHSQECRRILDRLCGYCLSPMLWNSFGQYNLSCGRVQSCVLGFCVERLNEIQNHEIDIKYEIKANFVYDKNMKLNNCHNKEYVFADEAIALNKLKTIEWKGFKISCMMKDTNKNPSSPYITTSAQIDAHKLLKISAKECMQLLQTLYENGCITYHRTDSLAISDKFKEKIKSKIIADYGTEYVCIRNHKTKDKNAQEAHECIRATNLDVVVPAFEGVTEKHKKLYKMIWTRTITSQMAAAVYKEFLYHIFNNTAEFMTSASALTFKGFLILENDAPLDDIEKYLISPDKPIELKELNCSPFLKSAKSLYTDGDLIKEMENKGVGRPSTYASIISILYDRGYVEKGENPNKEIKINKHILKGAKKPLEAKEITLKTASDAKNLIKPTQMGINVYRFLLSKCDFITNHEFTSIMEENLDKIANNSLSSQTVLNSFNDKLNKVLDENPIPNKMNENDNAPYKLLKTKYGNCIYVRADKRYINIEGMLTWKEKLDAKEIEKIINLPKKFNEKYVLHIGKYGLYLKDHEGKNKALDKSLWHDALIA